MSENCDVSASMGTNITTINPSEEQLTIGMTKKVVTKIDSTPPYITNVRVPSGFTRNTHSTAIQFTIKDDESGLSSAKFKVFSYKDENYWENWDSANSSDVYKEFTGEKSYVHTFKRTDLYYLEESCLRIGIVLYDKAGNRTSEKIESEPTVPYKPLITQNGEVFGNRYMNYLPNDYRTYEYFQASEGSAIWVADIRTRTTSSGNSDQAHTLIGICDKSSDYVIWRSKSYNPNTNTYGPATAPSSSTKYQYEYMNKVFNVKKGPSSGWVYQAIKGSRLIRYENCSDWKVDDFVKSALDSYFSH